MLLLFWAGLKFIYHQHMCRIKWTKIICKQLCRTNVLKLGVRGLFAVAKTCYKVLSMHQLFTNVYTSLPCHSGI